MRLGHKAEGMEEGGIAAGVPGSVAVLRPSAVRCFAEMVHIGNEVIPAVFHQLVEARFKLLFQVIAHYAAQFTVLGA